MKTQPIFGIFRTKNGQPTHQLMSSFIYTSETEANERVARLNKTGTTTIGDAEFGYSVGQLTLV